ncbi:MAG: response regulator [Candidatus Komeilibacteria bacterium]
MTKQEKKVLVAEDDHFLAKIYKIKLAKEGINAEIATDGNEALAKIKELKPDLVLLDLVMPGKDGFEILEDLQSDKGLKKIPIIILSNLGQEADIIKGKSYGIVDYFIKSDISIHDVVKKIKEILND